MTLFRYLLLAVMLTATVMAQTPTNKTRNARANRSTAMAKDIQALRETVLRFWFISSLVGNTEAVRLKEFFDRSGLNEF
jgi:hypothetical protein